MRVNSNRRYTNTAPRGRRRVMAGEDVDGGAGATVAPEAQELLFEAEDVAELVAEVTGEPVDVTTDGDSASVTFGVGDDTYTVEAEGTEEVLESTRIPRRRRTVAASAQRGTRRGNTIRKYPSSKKNR